MTPEEVSYRECCRVTLRADIWIAARRAVFVQQRDVVAVYASRNGWLFLNVHQAWR